uniref:JAZF zinc finger 1 n=1 Tax=Gallus gallus TaxID=9031 RepID=A0A8V0XBE8_CHICK
AVPCTAVTERRWSLLPAAAASSPPTQPGPPLRRSRRRRRHLLLLSPPPPRSLPISRSVPFPPCPRLSPPRRRRPWQSRHGTAGGSRCNTMTGIAAASFFSNACRFGGCGLHFPTLAELIEHIEDNHIDTDPRVLEKQELQQPTYVALSYINSAQGITGDMDCLCCVSVS